MSEQSVPGTRTESNDTVPKLTEREHFVQAAAYIVEEFNGTASDGVLIEYVMYDMGHDGSITREQYVAERPWLADALREARAIRPGSTSVVSFDQAREFLVRNGIDMDCCDSYRADGTIDYPIARAAVLLRLSGCRPNDTFWRDFRRAWGEWRCSEAPRPTTDWAGDDIPF